jgi:hypothetical protein
MGQQPVSVLGEQQTDAIAAAQRRRLKEQGMTASLTVLSLGMIAAMATRTIPTPDVQAATTFVAAVAGVLLASAAALWARHNGMVHLEVHKGRLHTELEVPPSSCPLQLSQTGAVTVRSCHNCKLKRSSLPNMLRATVAEAQPRATLQRKTTGKQLALCRCEAPGLREAMGPLQRLTYQLARALASTRATCWAWRRTTGGTPLARCATSDVRGRAGKSQL